MIDIVYQAKEDSITVHVECDETILSNRQAEKIVQRWASQVREALTLDFE